MNVRPPPLVGRDEEMARVSDLLHEAAHGHGRILLIEGEAGIGKTRMVDEAVALTRDLGFSILRSAGEELERRRPFGVLAEALELDPRSSDERRTSIAKMLVGEAAADPAGDLFAVAAEAEFRIAEAILVLVEDLCARAPVALAVEDLQWADSSSLMVLHRLGRRVEALSLCLVGTVRPVPRTADLEKLLRSLLTQGATHVSLGPLGDSAVVELVGGVIGAEPGPKLLSEVKGAAGNPLFVLELLETLQREGHLHRTETGQADVVEAAAPPSLRLTFLHRLGFLPEEALELLRVASVLGSTFSVDDLSVVLGGTAAELLRPLEECRRAGILSEERERLRFRHDLIREALYEDLPQGVRNALHLQAGRALAAAGRPPEQVAEHMGRGASRGDREAVEWLHRAAREAGARSPNAAVEILNRALALTDPDPGDPERDHLLTEQAVCLIWAGRIREAETTCREVLERHHDPSLDGTLHWGLVSAVAGSGRGSEAIQEVLTTVASADVQPVDRLLLKSWASAGLMAAGDLARSEDLAREVVQESQHVRDDLALCTALATLGAVANSRGNYREGLDVVDQAVRVADRSEARRGHRYIVYIVRSVSCMYLDRFEEARADIVRALGIGEDLGIRWHLPFYHFSAQVEAFWTGKWDDAIVEYETGMEVAEETGLRTCVLPAASVRALIALHRGELEQAEEALGIAQAEFDTTGRIFGLDWMMLAASLRLEAAGNAEQAASMLANAWDLAAAAGVAVYYPVFGPDLVRLALETRDRPRAEAVVRNLEHQQARNQGIASLLGAARTSRGLLEGDPDVLFEAVAAYRQTPRPLERGQACEEAGRVIGRLGRVDEARDLISDALAIYEALGASRDIARADSVLREFGIRRGRAGSRNRPRFGWESLTATEARVVALVAEGLSNPQIADRMFISRHTVHTHVSHALAKLGLSSRVELATEAARRGA